MDIVELSRRLENLIRIGTIHTVDHDAVRCRVQTGGLLSNWLRWHTPRAGETTSWDPPTPGEQCIILSPSGEAGNGVVIYGLNSNLIAPPSHHPAEHVVRFPDSAIATYNHVTNTLDVYTPGKINIVTKGPVNLTSEGEVTVKSDSDIIAESKASITIEAAESVEIVALGNVSIFSMGGSDTKISVSGNAEINASGFIQYLSDQDILIRGETGVILQGPTGTIRL